jgi:hypothetical protein
MKMNDFVRVNALEEAFKERHGIKPEVYRQRVSYNEYTIKLVYNGKEALINEVMDRGLTKRVTLNGDEIKKTFYETELEAVKLLEGK